MFRPSGIHQGERPYPGSSLPVARPEPTDATHNLPDDPWEFAGNLPTDSFTSQYRTIQAVVENGRPQPSRLEDAQPPARAARPSTGGGRPAGSTAARRTLRHQLAEFEFRAAEAKESIAFLEQHCSALEGALHSAQYYAHHTGVMNEQLAAENRRLRSELNRLKGDPAQ